MGGLIEFLAAPAPLWTALVLIAVAGAAGWFWGRAAVADQRLRAEAAERAARYAASRAAVQQPATEALTRVLAGPRSIRPEDDLDRFLAEEWTKPEFRDAYQRAEADAAVIRTAVLPKPALDLADAYDVYGTDDEPDDDAVDQDEPPADAGAVPAEVYQAAVLPRYQWSGADPWPAHQGVMPDRWSMLRWRLDRWTVGAREAWGRLRAYLAERWENIDWDRSPGWAPGEATRVMTGEQPAVVSTPAPITRPPQHLAGYRKVWAAVLVGEFRRTGAAGRHRAGVAVGALAQRQLRLLALPAGAR